MTSNLQVRLGSLPLTAVQEEHFALHESPMPNPAVGEVLVRNAYLSLDPYMRKRLADAVAGRVHMAPGDLMMGRTVGEVVVSRAAGFRPGDHVLGWGGWQQYSAEPAAKLEKVEAIEGVPLSMHLGVLGRPGITAWLGVVHEARLQPSECFVVSSAAGAVGSLAGQIALHIGARAVGIAGGPAKCDAVTRELGFDACIDYKASDFQLSLREATPRGVDACFENVGAAVLDATLERMNENGRIAVCGLLAHYHSGAAYPMQNFPRVLDRALRVTGFRIDSHPGLHAQARADLRTWLAKGVFRTWETVAPSLQAAPAAFVAMLAGGGRGKTLVRLT